MEIELRGVEFVNKGAELMLQAIVDQVKKRIPDAVFVMEKGPVVPVEKLRKNNIYVKIDGPLYSNLLKWTSRSYRRKRGYVLDNEIKVILDGSGFAFGDQWGAGKAKRILGKNIARWKRQEKKVILLPQAFGPFSEPELRKVMSKILTHVDLVFAREQQSYDYLKGISQTDRLRMAPDFTNLISGSLPPDFDPKKHRVAIIPNSKMIDKNEGKGQDYFNFLLTSVRTVSSLGLNPYFLIHEGRRDLAIAERANEVLDHPLPVIVHDDPLVVKGIIGSAYFIICSRFHGLVSALSQGVPCIATSWSHKYEMLLNEYDYEEALVRELDNGVLIKKLIERVADPAVNREISEKLQRCSNVQKERSMKMWETVFNTISD